MSDEGLLTENQLLLAEREVTYGVDPIPDPLTQAILTQLPVYTPDIRLLERPNLKTSLSKEQPVTGRKMSRIRFSAEVKANAANTRYDPLFRACMMKRLFGQAVKGTITGTFTELETVTQSVGSDTASGKLLAVVIIGADKFLIIDEFGSPVPFSGAGTITGGTSAATMAAPLAYSPMAAWHPRSCDFESVTIYLFKGGCTAIGDPADRGLLHKLTGAYGSVGLRAVAGDYGLYDFEFDGLWNDVVDAIVPVAAFDNTRPPVVESTDFSFGGFQAVANSVTWQLGVTRGTRPSLRADEGLKAIKTTKREPTGTIDPEAVLEAEHPFWANLQNATAQELRLRIGAAASNRSLYIARKCVANTQEYDDREGTMTYSRPFTMCKNTDAGDDELFIINF